jgi:predicted transcriptional regulator
MIENPPEITPCDNRPPLAERPEDREWRAIHRLLTTAQQYQSVVVPESLDLAALQEMLARQGNGTPPAPALVKREVARVREQIAWGARQAGFTQWQIAKELGISQPAVFKMLRRIEKRVLARMEEDVRAVKLKQQQQIDYVISQALHAWRESREKNEQHEVTVVGNDLGKSGTRHTTHRSLGNPKYLKVALDALAAERELWGLNRSRPADEPPPDPTIQATATSFESVTVRRACPERLERPMAILECE